MVVGLLEAEGEQAEQFSRFERRRDLASLFRLLWYALLLFPRDEDRWIFGASNGRGFSGNTKWLFLEALEKHPDKTITWVTLEPGIRDDLREEGYPAVLATRPPGVWAMLRAGRAFMTHGPWDFVPPFVGGAEWVQLWHGTTVFKAFKEFREDAIPWADKLPWLSRAYDLIVAPHQEDIELYADAFPVREGGVEALGAPVLEGLYRADPTLPDVEERAEEIAAGQDLVLFLPTWRPWMQSAGIAELLEQAGWDRDTAETRLAAMDACLAIKPHPYMPLGDVQDSERVRFLDHDDWPDPFPTLRRADLVVTDYSSIVFEFLPLDRPVAFLLPDADRFEQEGLLWKDEVQEKMGPCASSWTELWPWVERQLSGQDPYQEGRREIAQRAWADMEADVSARVLAAIEEKLDGPTDGR